MWLFGGKVDRKKIDEDEQKLYAYYRALGFFQAKIGHELEYNESKTWLTLRFVINEGPRYSIRNVSFIGNERFNVGQLNKNLQQIAGKPFDQSTLDHDLAGIRDVYGGHGYVFADIQHDVRLSEDKPELDLVYNIAEGKQYKVGQINIHIAGDDPHTAHATILDRMSLKPGDIVDTRKLRDDERRLKFSSIFNTDPTKGGPPKIAFVKSGDKDDRDLVDRDGSDSGNKNRRAGTPDNYRGQSPDTEILDGYPSLDANGKLTLVLTPRSNSIAGGVSRGLEQAALSKSRHKQLVGLYQHAGGQRIAERLGNSAGSFDPQLLAARRASAAGLFGDFAPGIRRSAGGCCTHRDIAVFQRGFPSSACGWPLAATVRFADHGAARGLRASRAAGRLWTACQFGAGLWTARRAANESANGSCPRCQCVWPRTGCKRRDALRECSTFQFVARAGAAGIRIRHFRPAR